MAVEKFKTLVDFPDQSAGIQIIYSVVSAFPNFFPIFLFLFWIFMTGSGYFITLKTTGLKRFWQYSTALSFATFISSLFLVAMNDQTLNIVVLSPYWILFYIFMVAVNWYGLKQYK